VRESGRWICKQKLQKVEHGNNVIGILIEGRVLGKELLLQKKIYIKLKEFEFKLEVCNTVAMLRFHHLGVQPHEKVRNNSEAIFGELRYQSGFYHVLDVKVKLLQISKLHLAHKEY